MPVLIQSLPDTASRTIAGELGRLTPWAPTRHTVDGTPVLTATDHDGLLLATIKDLHIHAEDLEARLRHAGVAPDEIVFLSRHASKTGRATLTVHPLGNFAEAAYGGRPGVFTPVPAGRMSQTLRALAAARDEASYPAEVAFEVTHHGPALATPAFFVELGSTPAQWQDPAGGRTVAQAVLAAATAPVPRHPVLLGLGGGHYAPRFTENALTRAVHYGHLWPAHHMTDRVDAATTLAALAQATPDLAGVHRHQVPRAWRAVLDDALQKAGLAEADPAALAPST